MICRDYAYEVGTVAVRGWRPFGEVVELRPFNRQLETASPTPTRPNCPARPPDTEAVGTDQPVRNLADPRRLTPLEN